MVINLETCINLETSLLTWKRHYKLENIAMNLETLFLLWKHNFQQ